MVTQEREASAVAKYVKRIVEEETGENYILKSRDELVHPDNLSWFLHLPIGKAGWLDHVQQNDESLVFESVYIYDAHKVIEYEYRSCLKSESLRFDLDSFHLKETREKYLRVVPKVVKFFDAGEGLVSVVNKAHHTNMSLVNSGGLVVVRIEIGIEQLEKEGAIRENLQAMKDLLNQVASWLEEQRKKSLHMAQIKRTHHRLLESTEESAIK